MIKSHAGAAEMRSWLKDPLVTPGDHMIVGYLDLRAIEVRPTINRLKKIWVTSLMKQNEARTQLGHVKAPGLVESVKTAAIEQIEAWTDEWCLGRLVQAGTNDRSHVVK